MIAMLRSGLLCAAMTVVFVLPAAAKGKTLVTLDGTNGSDVFVSLTQGSDGNFYGATAWGGANSEGTIFKMTPKGKYTVLYNFCSQSNCTDGANGAWLTEGSDGNFYGMANAGGTANYGTIFEITPSGKFTTLYNFCSQTNCTDGANPFAALLQTSDGAFWGTTIGGGANGKGTVFKFVPGNAPQIIYSFCSQSGCSDGSNPFVGLTLASDGNFYGTTAEGGNDASTCPIKSYGCGTVFRITTSGTLTTLHTFCTQTNCPDGQIPQGLLIQAKDGNLYGTTDAGGSVYNQGSVFRISLDGKLKTLHRFCSTGECSDGLLPYAGVIQAKDGNFYGTTEDGGPNAWGNVYRLTEKAKFTSVYSVDSTDGAGIQAAVIQASDGKLYGGTQEGGNTNCKYGCGVIFSVSLKGRDAISVNHASGHAVTVPATGARPVFPLSPLTASAR